MRRVRDCKLDIQKARTLGPVQRNQAWAHIQVIELLLRGGDLLACGVDIREQ